MLQELLAALQLQVGAGGFNLGLLEVGAGLGGVAALQCADLLAFADFLAGQHLERDDASADGRVDVNDVSRVRHDPRRQHELIAHRLPVHGGRLDGVLRRSVFGRRRGLLVLAGGSEKKQCGWNGYGKLAPGFVLRMEKIMGGSPWRRRS